MASNQEQERLVVSAAAFTDTGQVRKHNEDYVAYHIPKEEKAGEPSGALLVVCDGVGGGAAGEIASEHAVHRILNDYYQAPAEQPPLARLLSAIQQANVEILQQNAGQTDARRMTTTVVAAALAESYAVVVHAGDSRAYLVRGGQISQLTRDHSWVAEMVRSGDLTAQEAEAHPWRNRITRALGMKENLDLDSQTLELKAGDRLILCSDGLTRHVSDAEIMETASRQPPRQASQQLISLANQRGGADNISVIVAELSAPQAVREGKPVAGGEDKPQPLAEPRPGSRRAWPLYVVGGVVIVALLAAGLMLALRTLARPTDTATPSAAPPPAATTALPAAPAAAPTTEASGAGLVPTGTSMATETPPPPTSTTRPSTTPTLAATATVTRTLSPTAALTLTAAPETTPTTVAGGNSAWRQWVSAVLTRVAIPRLPTAAALPIPKRP